MVKFKLSSQSDSSLKCHEKDVSLVAPAIDLTSVSVFNCCWHKIVFDFTLSVAENGFKCIHNSISHNLTEWKEDLRVERIVE